MWWNNDIINECVYYHIIFWFSCFVLCLYVTMLFFLSTISIFNSPLLHILLIANIWFLIWFCYPCVSFRLLSKISNKKQENCNTILHTIHFVWKKVLNQKWERKRGRDEKAPDSLLLIRFPQFRSVQTITYGFSKCLWHIHRPTVQARESRLSILL